MALLACFQLLPSALCKIQKFARCKCPVWVSKEFSCVWCTCEALLGALRYTRYLGKKFKPHRIKLMGCGYFEQISRGIM